MRRTVARSAGERSRSGSKLTDSRSLPCYLTAILIGKPLHFGDYGGMPMQIIWALLDIATIIVLGSGLYLWLKRGNPVPASPRAAAHEARVSGGTAQPEPASAMKVQA